MSNVRWVALAAVALLCLPIAALARGGALGVSTGRIAVRYRFQLPRAAPAPPAAGRFRGYTGAPPTVVRVVRPRYVPARPLYVVNRGPAYSEPPIFVSVPGYVVNSAWRPGPITWLTVAFPIALLLVLVGIVVIRSCCLEARRRGE